jgi:NAD-dependent deacetylase
VPISPILIDRLRQARRVMVLTGKGIAAESGIPNFDAEMAGFLAAFNFDSKHLVAQKAFRKDPALVWGWYEPKRSALLNVQPSPAHLAIAALQKHIPRLTVATENFDDLHERAGSKKVLHYFGNILRPKCFDCDRTYRSLLPLPLESAVGQPIQPPRCGHCNGLVRPGFWFPETFPSKSLLRAEHAAQTCEVMLMLGIANLAIPKTILVSMAHQAGAIIVDIQPEGAVLDYCPVGKHLKGAIETLTGDPEIVMPELLRVAFGEA